MIELYQAEWCPFSAAVRERMTELRLEFVAHQVAPWPEERIALRQRSQMPGPRRSPGRRALARGLHHLADRLDN